MDVGLNIKNDETCSLARDLARLTGETMTGAITVALRERLEREKRRRDLDARVEALLAIGRRCAETQWRARAPPPGDGSRWLQDVWKAAG